MLIAYCLLLIAYCLLFIAYCLLFIAYCLLLIAYCLLFIAYFIPTSNPLTGSSTCSTVWAFNSSDVVVFSKVSNLISIGKVVVVAPWTSPSLLFSSVIG
ncbi:hypothetical protein COZ26_00845 [Candidatus Kuenenbacteria bacterium CG_4_10_14_3_um_filter_39_14]|uniref:Uncharacterized protein n=1 Tax=Candidatus Kuenenbacteria bacterium CG_4_10_14_3_um_filter_39_14 TaxID=1974614 RepID=A0A2M7MHV8_9BACT|nr:MAG: hypothetical protein COZ26_00845 [Candidatus Kuenenbacteria bacterium CG_4_10_14_3_um_filter_39_14]